VTAQEWIAAFATEIGVSPPDEETVETLLGIAGVAAHASERTAAPITCYLIGQSGVDLTRARLVAEKLAQASDTR
jgi:hypothetical protein